LEDDLPSLQSITRSSVTLLFALVSFSAFSADQAPPVKLTAEQDHQRMMDLLHIKELRRGADGRDPKAPNYASYDESKANPYPKLPDPLTLKNGKKVTGAKTWWKKRRPEIVEDFDREIYGRMPKNTPKVNWEVISTKEEMNGDVPVVTKELIGHVDNSAYPQIKVDIQLTLSTPAIATAPVPVMMEFGLSAEMRAIFAKRFPQPPTPGPTWQQQVLAKGWGYADLVATSIQADNGAGLTEGIIGLVNKGQPRKLDDWGALRAWAWGASRALDYFETDKAVDAKQVGIEGHSRYGKATLVTMAYDPRFAIAYVSSSGAGGAALWRRHWGEEIGNVAGTGEYHWMDGNFLQYAGPLTPNDFPVDQHELIALCAPRPVFVSGGSLQAGDGWLDPKGMFMAAAAAGPVYKLLGKKDMGATEFPPMETSLIDGDIAFRQHSGGHIPAPNWPTFITFATRYLKSPVMTATEASTTRGEVALTFDDLPSHGPLPQGMTRVDIANSIIGTLQAERAPPTYGFINAKRVDEDPSTSQVLQLWRDAGNPLGNHTFSHMDLNTNSAHAFQQDLLANEATLQKFMGDRDWRWLRYPFLREGDTVEKHRAITSFLKDHKYRVAEVTLSFGDYAYNEPYARCLAKNDQQSIDWLKQSYLTGASDSLADGEKRARLVYGRDIKHVMLLHIGGFETVMFPRLLELLQQKNFKLITLQEAESDPAYATDADLPSNWGGTFLQQMMRAKNIPEFTQSQNTFAKLDALCR
jgi:peptidoglycan/xylan/chitin deacetylase (PgdA/CDA1 family)